VGLFLFPATTRALPALVSYENSPEIFLYFAKFKGITETLI